MSYDNPTTQHEFLEGVYLSAVIPLIQSKNAELHSVEPFKSVTELFRLAALVKDSYGREDEEMRRVNYLALASALNEETPGLAVVDMSSEYLGLSSVAKAQVQLLKNQEDIERPVELLPEHIQNALNPVDFTRNIGDPEGDLEAYIEQTLPYDNELFEVTEAFLLSHALWVATRMVNSADRQTEYAEDCARYRWVASLINQRYGDIAHLGQGLILLSDRQVKSPLREPEDQGLGLI